MELEIDFQPASPNNYGSLELSGQEDTTIITQDQRYIDREYTKVKVLDSNQHSQWVIYDDTLYRSPDYKGAKVIRACDGEVDYGKPIKSARGFNTTDPGIILFEDCCFGGKTRAIQSSDLKSDETLESFPASSFIVTGGTWICFSQYNHKGTQLSAQKRDEFGPGDCISHGDTNKKIKSVKLIQT